MLPTGNCTIDSQFSSIGTSSSIGECEFVVSNTASPLSVPQMVRMGDSLIFAWTEIRDDAERIASAKLPISTLGER